MPWVGLVLYALHLPAILTAITAGTKLLKLPLAPEEEPFLAPAGAAVTAATENGAGHSIAPAAAAPPQADGAVTNGHH